MGLPTPAELNELSGKIVQQGGLCMGNWDRFAVVLKSIMTKVAPAAVQTGVSEGVAAAGVSSGVTVGFQAGAVALGVTIAPIGAALAPWVAAASVASQAGKIFSLHDIKADAVKGGNPEVTYSCVCSACAKNIGYIIDKKERNVALVALAVATVGATAVVKVAHSIGKKLYSALKGEQRPKELACRALVNSARGGCTTAMATIFLLSGSWSFMGDRSAETMATAVAIITSEDGWEKLRSLW